MVFWVAIQELFGPALITGLPFLISKLKRSKIFMKMMGTSCDLQWREIGERERLWVTRPSHPIVKGIGPYIELPEVEMYGEYFDIPEPESLVFVSWYEGGEVFRSGATWQRGKGKIFYFKPGHETYPIYYNKDILKVIENSVRWAKFAKLKLLSRNC